MVICAAAALLCLNIRSIRPEIAVAVALAAGVFAAGLSIKELSAITGMVKEALLQAEIRSGDAETILKAAGIAIAGEYGAQLCRDAGEGALAQRVDMAVRISLIALACPVAYRALNIISELGI